MIQYTVLFAVLSIVVLAIRALRIRHASAQLTGSWRGGDGRIRLWMEIVQRGTDLSGNALLEWQRDRLALELSGWNDAIGRVQIGLHDPTEDRTMWFAAQIRASGAMIGNFRGEFRNPTPVTLHQTEQVHRMVIRSGRRGHVKMRMAKTGRDASRVVMSRRARNWILQFAGIVAFGGIARVYGGTVAFEGALGVLLVFLVVTAIAQKQKQNTPQREPGNAYLVMAGWFFVFLKHGAYGQDIPAELNLSQEEAERFRTERSALLVAAHWVPFVENLYFDFNLHDESQRWRLDDALEKLSAVMEWVHLKAVWYDDVERLLAISDYAASLQRFKGRVEGYLNRLDHAFGTPEGVDARRTAESFASAVRGEAAVDAARDAALIQYAESKVASIQRSAWYAIERIAFDYQWAPEHLQQLINEMK